MYLPSNDFVSRQFTYNANPGAHVAIARISYAVPVDTIAYLTYFYLRINSTLAVGGIANGSISIVHSPISGGSYILEEFPLPLAAGFITYNLALSYRLASLDILTFSTVQPGIGGVGYNITTQLWEYV